MTKKNTHTGPKNALTDIVGLTIGHAEDEKVRTGVSVILCERPAIAAVDVRGGGPGTRETDALAPHNLVERVDALVLSGGSVYGLGAADGVCAVLGTKGRGFSRPEYQGVPGSPIVPAAVLYDLANGGDKNWGDQPPYAALGRKALKAATRDFAQGNVGAGYGALAGAIKGGLGSASASSHDGLLVGALAAVNCFGSALIPGTRHFWAAPFEQGDEFGGLGWPPDALFDGDAWGAAKRQSGARQNTTLAVIACSARLDQGQCQRLAIMAQDGLARAIRPVHTPFDGDVVFALAMGAEDQPKVDEMTLARLGNQAADALARAVARGVYAARGLGKAKAWRDYSAPQ